MLRATIIGGPNLNRLVKEYLILLPTIIISNKYPFVLHFLRISKSFIVSRHTQRFTVWV